MPTETAVAKAASDLSAALGGVKVFTEMPPPAVATDDGDLAGVYELTALSWDERYVVLVPHPVTGQLVQTEHIKRHHQGDLVTLSQQEAKRLLRADAVVVPGAREALEAERLAAVVEAQKRQLKEAQKRKEAAAAALSSDDLSDQQRHLLELELNRAHPGAGQSVAPGTEED